MTLDPAPGGPDEEGLDQLLAEARWPRPEQTRVTRLRGRWQVLSAARRRRLRLFRISTVLAAGLAGALLVWWTFPVAQDRVAVDDLATPAITGNRHSPPIEKTTIVPDERIAADKIPSAAAIVQPDSPAIAHVETPTITAGETTAHSRPPTALERIVFAASEQKRRQQSREQWDVLLNEVLAQVDGTHEENGESLIAPLLQQRRYHASRLMQIARADRNANRRQSAIRLLANLGDSSAIGLLAEFSREEASREVAFPALLKLADSQTLAGLIAEESDDVLRQRMLAGLIDRRDPASTVLFLQFVDDSSTQQTALASLSRCNNPPVELLFEFLETARTDGRVAAGRVLGRLCDPDVVDQLIGMAQRELFPHESMVALLQCPGERASDFVSFARTNPRFWPAIRAAEIHLQATSPYNFRKSFQLEFN